MDNKHTTIEISSENKQTIELDPHFKSSRSVVFWHMSIQLMALTANKWHDNNWRAWSDVS